MAESSAATRIGILSDCQIVATDAASASVTFGQLTSCRTPRTFSFGVTLARIYIIRGRAASRELEGLDHLQQRDGHRYHRQISDAHILFRRARGPPGGGPHRCRAEGHVAVISRSESRFLHRRCRARAFSPRRPRKLSHSTEVISTTRPLPFTSFLPVKLIHDCCRGYDACIRDRHGATE